MGTWHPRLLRRPARAPPPISRWPLRGQLRPALHRDRRRRGAPCRQRRRGATARGAGVPGGCAGAGGRAAGRRRGVAGEPAGRGRGPAVRLFRAYEVAFFGFGRPSRLEPVSMIRHGEVQVSVALDPAHMNAFKAHINNSMPRSHYKLYTTHFLGSLVRQPGHRVQWIWLTCFGLPHKSLHFSADENAQPQPMDWIYKTRIQRVQMTTSIQVNYYQYQHQTCWTANHHSPLHEESCTAST